MRVLSVVHELDAGAGVFGEFETWVPSSGPPPVDDFDALMIFGGSMHVDQNDGHPWLTPEKQFIRDAPGARDADPRRLPRIAAAGRGGGRRPFRMPEPEIGWYEIEITDAGAADPVVGPLAPSVELFEWHHYAAPLPPGAVELARTPASMQAFRIEGKPAWGLQFHAEVTRENLFGWLDGWEQAEARFTDFDPDAIRAASELRIEGQNEVGRATRGAIPGRSRPKLGPCA